MAPDDILTEYAYLSCISDSWLKSAAAYRSTIAEPGALRPDRLIVELASTKDF